MNFTGNLNIIVPLTTLIIIAGGLAIKMIPRRGSAVDLKKSIAELKEYITGELKKLSSVEQQVAQLVGALEVVSERTINNKSASKAAHRRLDELLIKFNQGE
jgi:cell division protein FtsL